MSSYMTVQHKGQIIQVPITGPIGDTPPEKSYSVKFNENEFTIIRAPANSDLYTYNVLPCKNFDGCIDHLIEWYENELI